MAWPLDCGSPLPLPGLRAAHGASLECEASAPLCSAARLGAPPASLVDGHPAGRRAEVPRPKRSRGSALQTDQQFNASSTARGRRAATRRRSRAGPVGWRRPCSQLRSVPELMPKAAANSVWLRRKRARIEATESGEMRSTRTTACLSPLSAAESSRTPCRRFLKSESFKGGRLELLNLLGSEIFKFVFGVGKDEVDVPIRREVVVNDSGAPAFPVAPCRAANFAQAPSTGNNVARVRLLHEGDFQLQNIPLRQQSGG